MSDPKNSRDADSRLEEIEAKLMFAEDLLETLNRTVYRQQQHIDRLEHEVRGIREQLQASGSATALNSLQDELPPHY